MGLLSIAALYNLPNNTAIADAQVLKAKILTKKSNAIGYRQNGSDDYYCIEFSKDYLNNDDDKVKYTFKSEITVNGLDSGRVCFDYLGRPFDGEVDDNLSKLIHKNVIISLKYAHEEQNITIYPISGEVH